MTEHAYFGSWNSAQTSHIKVAARVNNQECNCDPLFYGPDARHAAFVTSCSYISTLWKIKNHTFLVLLYQLSYGTELHAPTNWRIRRNVKEYAKTVVLVREIVGFSA